LRFILRHCGVQKVRLIPHDLRALPEPAPAKAGGAFYEAVLFGKFFDFLRVHQS
jgi:hypothetical protein